MFWLNVEEEVEEVQSAYIHPLMVNRRRENVGDRTAKKNITWERLELGTRAKKDNKDSGRKPFKSAVDTKSTAIHTTSASFSYTLHYSAGIFGFRVIHVSCFNNLRPFH